MKITAYLLILFCSVIASSNSYALSCNITYDKELIDDYDVIFKGYATSSRVVYYESANETDPITIQKSITTFVIDKLYKGKNSQEINILHSSNTSFWGKNFVKNEPMLIFAKNDNIPNQVQLGLCDPNFEVHQIPQRITDLLLDFIEQKKSNVISK
ncbi:hypothetical protein [Pseudemcibacter aquimaris]|uniref:hypothetical protein n=1 Tax=Pseudemcibacter aquimaris TaxID=2857064 RepID=UPI002012DE11|nr:hypothetical protein [Pseudemcibacter aquimaris]MCC3861247.1 hypothetical protein [Pseudemcibacter aquimaris]WDU58021.1 hypothetical protein KW060_12555 [Pseudemcibacter aquimaris]